MSFDLIDQLFSEWDSIMAMEATSTKKDSTSKATDPDVSMKIEIVTDKAITSHYLKQCSDPISFTAAGIPTEGGIFSEEIFGSQPAMRQRQCAYIELYDRFFHPYVFEVLEFLYPRKFNKCASGEGSFGIDENGMLVEYKPDDANYNPNNTGMDWLIKNYPKLKFKESDSQIRKDRIKMITNLTKDETFITKWIVIPVFYRDIDMNSSVRKLPELDEKYNTLIRYANSLRDATFDFFNNQVKYNIQRTLIDIRKHGQSLIEGKKGFFHKSILGKSIDRGSRDVITNPSLQGYQRPEDNPIDNHHVGVPLAKCLIIGYDFILRWINMFFEDNFKNMTAYPVYDLIDGKYEIVGEIPIKNPLERFTPYYIEKKIKKFLKSQGTRFEPITIETEDGKEIPFRMSGFLGNLTEGDITASPILNRPYTWTDIFYQASYHTLSDKYAYVTRYPINQMNNMMLAKVHVMSTLKTIPVHIDGTFYKHYPYVDFDMSINDIANSFRHTLNITDSRLISMGGDFDGDTAIIRMCYTIEANEEAKRNLESPNNYVYPNGKMVISLDNEYYLCSYNFTRDTCTKSERPGKMITAEQKAELLALDYNKMTIDSISKLITSSCDLTTNDKKDVFKKQNAPKFYLRDKMILEKGEYINKERVETTVGRFLYNKIFYEGILTEKIIPEGYVNVSLTSKAVDKINGLIGKALVDKVIDAYQFCDIVKRLEFWSLVLVGMISPSYSVEMVAPNKEVARYKEELLKNRKDDSAATYIEIEDKLVKKADELTKGTDGKTIFDSGSRGSFDNDYKNMTLSVGVVKNEITGDYDFMSSNYIDGIKKEDIPQASNIILNAEYPKAVGTAEGGYKQKMFYAVYQTITSDEPGTDCGTKAGLEIILTKDNMSKYIDQYIIDGSKLVLIDENLPASYFNKKIKIRSPLYCKGKKICNKCLGERYYKLDFRNIGLTAGEFPGAMVNAGMKQRHSLKVKSSKINLDDILI